MPGLTCDRDDRAAAFDQISNTSSSTASSASRPTSGEGRRAAASRSPATRNASTVSAFPFSSSSPSDSSSNVFDLARGCGPDDDSARPGVLLKTGSDVDGVAEGVVALLAGASSASRTTGPVLMPIRAASSIPYASLTSRAYPASASWIAQRRAHGPLSVVLVRARHAEERIETVSRQLRNGAAEALDVCRR